GRVGGVAGEGGGGGWAGEGLAFGCGREGADGGHAEADGGVPADNGDRLINLGAIGGRQLGDVTFDPVDELADAGDLFAGRGGVGAGPVVDAVDGCREPLPGAQQVIEVGDEVGQVGDVGAEVVTAGAAEPDRARPAAGGDVGWLGAPAVGDGGLAGS